MGCDCGWDSGRAAFFVSARGRAASDNDAGSVGELEDAIDDSGGGAAPAIWLLSGSDDNENGNVCSGENVGGRDREPQLPESGSWKPEAAAPMDSACAVECAGGVGDLEEGEPLVVAAFPLALAAGLLLPTDVLAADGSCTDETAPPICHAFGGTVERLVIRESL